MQGISLYVAALEVCHTVGFQAGYGSNIHVPILVQ